MRIVKAGAKPTVLVPLMHKVYEESDTIEIKKGWRPEDAHDIFADIPSPICEEHIFCAKHKDCDTCPIWKLIECTFDACIEAMEAKSHD